jgi:hypothetical protein
MTLKSILRSSSALLFLFFSTATVCAQQGGGDTGTGTAADGNTGDAGEGGSLATFDAETAFSAIDRGDTVGSTASTGAGFSDASAARGAGGGGGGAAGGGLGGLGGGFGGLGGFGNLFGNLNNQSSSTKPAIRTRLRSAVNVPATPPLQVQQIATRRFRSLASRPQLRGIQVTMQGRTAVISGRVRSDRDRRMSELLMRLEPGVGRVDNQVVVMTE